jgi:hypothetical protein
MRDERLSVWHQKWCAREYLALSYLLTVTDDDRVRSFHEYICQHMSYWQAEYSTLIPVTRLFPTFQAASQTAARLLTADDQKDAMEWCIRTVWQQVCYAKTDYPLARRISFGSVREGQGNADRTRM